MIAIGALAFFNWQRVITTGLTQKCTVRTIEGKYFFKVDNMWYPVYILGQKRAEELIQYNNEEVH